MVGAALAMSEIPFTTRPSRERPVRLASSSGRGRRRRGRRHGSGSPRRAARVLAFVLIGVGAFALIEAGVTLVWQEPFTALYAKFRQDHLAGTLRAIERATPTPVERRTLAGLPTERGRIAFLAGELEHHARNGDAVGRIVIPSLGASFVIVKGTGHRRTQERAGDLPPNELPRQVPPPPRSPDTAPPTWRPSATSTRCAGETGSCS